MPEVEDEEKDDGSRAAGGGPSAAAPLLPTISFYRGPLPIFLRTQHVVSAFIIIVIIISVDGPLMKRRLSSRAARRDSRGKGRRRKSRFCGTAKTARRKSWTVRRG